MYVVGLTGGIGSGKSEAARHFAALGADVEDADAVARALSARGEAGHRAIVDAFGRDCLSADGELDRDWLRERAFADAAFRERLERALHPLIGARIDATLAAWRAPYGVLVVPLLFEKGGLVSRVARVAVVDCPEEEQVGRVVRRSGLAAETVRAIMATQLTRAERLSRADDVIDNAGPPEGLVAQIAGLDAKYRALAAWKTQPAAGIGAQ
ncbi:MAG: dephospho-CoA kinase [Betaproteobacteria bacterium]